MFNFKCITICGGGNAAHVAVPLLSSRGYRVTLYAPFADEADKFRRGAAAGAMVMEYQDGGSVQGSPYQITNNPAAAAEADLILLMVPAFAHGPILAKLAPYLRGGTAVGAIPARSGFELEAAHHLFQEGVEDVTIFCGQTLPWACRIEEYGRKVKVLGTKETIGIAAVPSARVSHLTTALGRALNLQITPLPNSLTVSLGNIGQVIHPGIMYGLLKDYQGEVWSREEIPLFYQGVTEGVARALENLSAEIVDTAGDLSRHCDVDLTEVVTVGQWLLRSYLSYIEDSSSLARSFNTNRSYRGLKIPVKETDKGYIPDFQSRYLTEDVPFGLLYSKAVAEMIGKATPYIDEVIRVTERWMNKSYLDQEGNLVGANSQEGRTPQRFQIYSAADLVSASLKGLG